MPKSLLDRWPLVAAHPQVSVWLKIQSDLGLAQRTLDAYGRALDDFLSMCTPEQVDPDAAGRAEIARYVRHLTLFELQAWLGHCSPHTQHYAKLTPLTLAKAYTDAGYFARNIRAIEVLIDRDAGQSVATAPGSRWQYFDVGHGYCTSSSFEQRPHGVPALRLLRAQGLIESAAPRGQGKPPAVARRDSSHRGGACRRRGRPDRR